MPVAFDGPADILPFPGTAGRPPRVLFALASPSQMYSGIGRTIFETVRRCRGRIDYSFAIDDADPRNRDLLLEFCRAERVPVHVGRALELPDCQDRVSADLPWLLRHGDWDAVECVSFGSAATNATVLAHAGRVPIVYTPHYQPMWTVPAVPNVSRKIEAVHAAMVRSAAVVACDSPWEWLFHREQAGPHTNCVLLPLGFDPARFTPGDPDRQPYLLYVGDLKEIRKRFPLAVDVFAAVLARLPDFRLVVVGNRPDIAGDAVPAAVRDRVDLRGYVSEDELLAHYQQAAGLLQPSDYEAFGLPILEALACGTPVYLSRRPTVTGLFGRYRGVALLEDDTPERMAAAVVAGLSRGPAFVAEALADRDRLTADLGWDGLTDRRVRAIRVAANPRRRVTAAA